MITNNYNHHRHPKITFSSKECCFLFEWLMWFYLSPHLKRTLEVKKSEHSLLHAVQRKVDRIIISFGTCWRITSFPAMFDTISNKSRTQCCLFLLTSGVTVISIWIYFRWQRQKNQQINIPNMRHLMRLTAAFRNCLMNGPKKRERRGKQVRK